MALNQSLRILFLEDLPTDVELAKRMLNQEGIEFDSFTAADQEEFTRGLHDFQPDLIISDYMLPTFDGMQALAIAQQFDPSLPVIILTGSMNEDTAVTCLKAGAVDYVIKEHMTRLPLAVKGALEQKSIRLAKEASERTLKETNQILQAMIQASPLAINVIDEMGKIKLWSPAAEHLFGWAESEVIGQEIQIISAGQSDEDNTWLKERFSAKTLTTHETRRKHKNGSLIDVSISTAPIKDPAGQIIGSMAIIADVSEHKKNEEKLKQAHQELTFAYDDTIQGWSHALDMRDEETEGHSRRVTEVTLRLAKILGVKDEDLVHIRRGSLLHDIGKLSVPNEVLHKPGPLNEDEWQIMRKHPTNAYRMLFPIAYLRPALDIPYCHHEWWDGSGYPKGLKGEKIPLAARIFAVVDVWDALTSDRPYRKAWSVETTRQHILSESGTHFDPQVVEAFKEIV